MLRLIVLLPLLLASVARAESAPPPPAKAAPAPKAPVRVGPTTVTVIDEQESVDDIISRVRRARAQQPPAAAKTEAPPAPAVQPKDQRRLGKLRDGDGDDHPRRERLRERPRRLREHLKENRIRKAD